MDEFIEFLQLVLILLIVIVVFLLVPIIALNWWGCDSFASLNHTLAVKFQLPLSCMVKIPSGEWVDKDKIQQYLPILLQEVK